MPGTYPESEKLSTENTEWGAINQFLEFLSSKGVQLMSYTEGDWEEPCSGTLFNACINGFRATTDQDGNEQPSRAECKTCKGTGVEQKHHEGWTPVPTQQNLVYEYLDVDPAKLEAERRAMIAALSGEAS